MKGKKLYRSRENVMLAGVCGVIIGAVMAPMAAMYQGLDNL